MFQYLMQINSEDLLTDKVISVDVSKIDESDKLLMNFKKFLGVKKKSNT